jgi:hypothetical protein
VTVTMKISDDTRTYVHVTNQSREHNLESLQSESRLRAMQGDSKLLSVFPWPLIFKSESTK